MTRRSHLWLVAVASYLILSACLAVGVGWFGYGAALDQIERRGQVDLALASQRLTAELQRFRSLAVLSADRPEVSAALKGESAEGQSRALLREMADKTGAQDVLLVDRSGQEVLASLDDAAESHAGRPYFERALDGALGVYHMVSSRYGGRVFLFAAPVFSAEGPVDGAVIVVVDVDAVETAWRGDELVVFFTDELGVIFLSNRSELVFRTRDGSPREAGQSAEYPRGLISQWEAIGVRTFGGREHWRVDGGRYLPAHAIHLVQPLPVIDLTAHALPDVAPARQLAILQGAVAGALALAFGAIGFWVMERRRILTDENQRLEARVARRTQELERLNADLSREVAERTAAEARLKQAQADLVQAGKLSALGQMSAGISHELNQPLMAIRSFAENASSFIDAGKTDVAATNLTRISDLARRMGRIIRNLRAFASNESEPLADVDLVLVVDTALDMVAGRLSGDGIEVNWRHPGHSVMVRAGEVRLQQVVLNLITNAADAMASRDTKRLDLEISAGPKVTLDVRDTGPGIAEPDKIFEPFYTTKSTGTDEGMGLGLSISYGLVQSFGGEIRGRNHAEGGAVFTVSLDPAAAQEAA